jgi:hypothetical protein
MKYELQELPWECQLSSYRDAVIVNANDDKLPDILMVGNYYENNIKMGRYDGDYGTLLINNGNKGFSCETLNGVVIKGQARKVRKVNIAGKDAFVVARNNDSAMVIRFSDVIKQ